MPKYILAHDIGTSGDKAVLFDDEGSILGSETASYETRSPCPGWYEQDPMDWWRAVVETTRRLLQGRDASRLAAISFSDQMHSCVCVDREGNPLYPNMIWTDRRAEPQARYLTERLGEETIYRITGHRPNSSYTLFKWMWIREHEPDVYRNTYKVLHAKEFIISRLTGEYVTEPTDATGTNMYDLVRGGWSSGILDCAGLDREKLPVVKRSTDVAGYVTRAASGETGIPEGVPVICGGGDGAMATVGAGCIRTSQACASMGTSAYIAATSDAPIFDPGMTTFNYAHVLDGKYIPCGAMSCCGSSFSWAKDIMGEPQVSEARRTDRSVYKLLDQLVLTSPPGARGLLFLPYLAGERSPRWDPDAKGAFIGLTLKHTRADMLRSVLEGVAFNLDIIFNVFRERLDIGQLTLIGGGSSGEVWSQIIADVMDIPVRKLNVTEYATSIGAAITAGIGAGLFRDFDVVNQYIHVEKILTPSAQNAGVYASLRGLFNDSYHSLNGVCRGLAGLS